MTWRKPVLIVLSLALLGGAFFVFHSVRSLPLPALVISAIDGGRPYRDVAEWYLEHAVPADEAIAFRTQTDQSLLQFTLAAYQGGIGPDGNERKGPVDGAHNARVLEVAKHFVRLGMDPNTRGPFGLTALHDAVLFDSPGAVEFLIQIGADPNVTAGPGMFAGSTPLELAAALHKQKPAAGRERVVQLLREAGAGRPRSSLHEH